MKETNITPLDRYGYDFIPTEYLPANKDEYWLRNTQSAPQNKNWRNLTPAEIYVLKQNGNYCSDWNNFMVRDPFASELIRDSNFYGLIRLGAMEKILLNYHDFCLPCGIRDSTIISCDIGDNAAIQHCTYISNYIIGDRCILFKIDEMQTTNHAKFGNGILKQGEDEHVRVWIEVMNEAGGRGILPFKDMIAADAFLWAAYRDDTNLTDKLLRITQQAYGEQRGYYGTIGSDSVIKSCAIIKDLAAGCSTYIKGANKLKNITILSSYDEPTQIGEGVELVNGIVGFGCHVFYGSKAVRFVMGRSCNLKYGARLIHSVLGDNSTVSCCEILNNLIFPVHEQHHNNSFLVASLIEGMSNMAAAATIGSNHNSRANDGEIRAKRGFWPGLAVSLKHSSCFASFTIIAKGEYPSELNIPLPFSLVNNNVHRNRLEVMPAYFWLHNLYALERNSWKSLDRDHRKVKVQHIETDYLAPDTAEEIVSALGLLESWLGEAGFSPGDMTGIDPAHDLQEMRAIPCRHLEKSRRHQVIVKPLEAIAAYRQMLRWYAVKTIAACYDTRPEPDFNALCTLLDNGGEQRVSAWVNIGGQIAPAFRVDTLRKDIGNGYYRNWDEIHAVYDLWHNSYQLDKACHAWAILKLLNNNDEITPEILKRELIASVSTRQWISNQIFATRAKDYRNTFKQATFRNTAEMEQVLGKPEANSFVRRSQEETQRYQKMASRVIARL